MKYLLDIQEREENTRGCILDENLDDGQFEDVARAIMSIRPTKVSEYELKVCLHLRRFVVINLSQLLALKGQTTRRTFALLGFQFLMPCHLVCFAL